MARRAEKVILLVEDDDLFRRSLQKVLQMHYKVLAAPHAEAALGLLAENTPDVVLLDLMLPGVEGLDLLRELRQRWPELTVVMLTAVEKIATVVEAIKLGAYDYLTKPVETEDLMLTLDRAIEANEMKRELEQRRRLQLMTNERYHLLGESRAIKRVRQEMELVARTDATVLVEGETGTGKELVARGIHASSARASGAFVAVNCGAIAKDLIEAEFFGHAKGAFTGANRTAPGKFELAHGGTLLLDEIGELPLDAQVKLLRVLEEQEFYPVGGSSLRRVDVRVIAATNRNLEQRVQAGTFRQDLYFRLNVYRILMPPLRQRDDDVLLLTEHFLREFNQKFDKSFQDIEPKAQDLLRAREWSGNVRELRNLVERVVLSEQGPTLRLEHLSFLDLGALPPVPAATAQPAAPSEAPSPADGAAFRLPNAGIDLEEVEKDLMKQALEMARQNKTRAARLLGLSPPTFYYRLQKYGLE